MQELVRRRAEGAVLASLDAFRAVVVHGPRQVGKTTLLNAIAGRTGRTVVSLDNRDDRQAVAADPHGFLRGLEGPVAIDEVQRGGDDLLLAIKTEVDASNDRGQFLLTGSTNFLTVPGLSETLAGRIDIVPLWPLSVGERLGGADAFVDRAFDDGPAGLLDHRGVTPSRADYLDLCLAGGYPEAVTMAPSTRRRWVTRYVATVLQREVEAAAEIRRADALARLVRLLAATSGSEEVVSRLADGVGIDRATASAYLAWIETVFLIHRVPAWTRSPSGKIIRRSKLFMVDSGVAAGLLGATAGALSKADDARTGLLLETFVAAEIAKQLTWSTVEATLHHHREDQGSEIDLVLESADGRIVCIEVKASTTVRAEDARWLQRMRDRVSATGTTFAAGVVLHTGTHRLRLADDVVALPLADLWT